MMVYGDCKICGATPINDATDLCEACEEAESDMDLYGDEDCDDEGEGDDAHPYEPPEFDCAGCGRHIIAIGLIEPPDNGLCAGCSLIGPERNKAVHDWQDGNISEAEFKRIYESAPEPPGLSIDPARPR